MNSEIQLQTEARLATDTGLTRINDEGVTEISQSLRQLFAGARCHPNIAQYSNYSRTPRG
jgi:hypothetical protein